MKKLKDNDVFSKKIGRLIFCFGQNGNNVEIIEVFFDGDCKIEDIRSFPYEAEIKKARKEVYNYFKSKRKLKA